MANTLTQIGIETGNTVEAYHVSQSIDAFTGAEAYDISLSGSFNMTGSINGEPGLVNPLTASYAITASYTLSSSYALSASHVVSSSYALSASYVVSSSYATTASYVNLVAGPNITINQAGTSFEISSSGTGGGLITWYTASGTTYTIPTGSNIGVIVTYSGANTVSLELQTANNIGDSVEIITRDTANGLIIVDYDAGQIRAWSTGSVTGGSITQANPGVDPTMKLIYTSASRWNIVRYMDNDLATSGSLFDSLVFQNT